MIDLQTLTYSGLGASALGLAAWMLWNTAKSRNDIDGRVINMIDTMTKSAVNPLSDMLAEERQEKRRAQDERDKITQKFIDYTAAQQKFYSGEVQKLRDEQAAALVIMQKEIADCHRSHEGCNSRLSDALRRLDSIENRKPIINVHNAPATAP